MQVSHDAHVFLDADDLKDLMARRSVRVTIAGGSITLSVAPEALGLWILNPNPPEAYASARSSNGHRGPGSGVPKKFRPEGYICRVCKKRFAYPGQIATHMRFTHPNKKGAHRLVKEAMERSRAKQAAKQAKA